MNRLFVQTTQLDVTMHRLCRLIRENALSRVVTPSGLDDKFAPGLGRALLYSLNRNQSNNENEPHPTSAVKSLVIHLHRLSRLECFQDVLTFIQTSNSLERLTLVGPKHGKELVDFTVTQHFLDALSNINKESSSSSSSVTQINMVRLQLKASRFIQMLRTNRKIAILQILDSALQRTNPREIQEITQALVQSNIQNIRYRTFLSRRIKIKTLLENPQVIGAKTDSYSDKILVAIINSLPLIESLEHLSLNLHYHQHYKNLDNLHFDMIQAFEENRSLTSVHLDQTGFSESERQLIQGFMQRNQSYMEQDGFSFSHEHPQGATLWNKNERNRRKKLKPVVGRGKQMRRPAFVDIKKTWNLPPSFQ